MQVYWIDVFNQAKALYAGFVDGGREAEALYNGFRLGLKYSVFGGLIQRWEQDDYKEPPSTEQYSVLSNIVAVQAIRNALTARFGVGPVRLVDPHKLIGLLPRCPYMVYGVMISPSSPTPEIYSSTLQRVLETGVMTIVDIGVLLDGNSNLNNPSLGEWVIDLAGEEIDESGN